MGDVTATRALKWIAPRWWGLTAMAAGLFTAGLVLCMLTAAGGDSAETWLDDLAETFAAMGAAAACAVAASRHTGRHRLAWALMGASAFSWGLGALAWDWYELIQGVEVPFPSLADAGYLAAVPLAVGAVLSFPVAFGRARAALNSVLDGLLIAAALLVVSWSTVLGAVYRAGGDSVLSTVLGLAYPLGDMAILTMILVRVGRSPRRGRFNLLLLAGGLATLAIADSSFAYLTASGTYASGNALDSGWVAGYLIIGLAALRAARQPVRSAPPRRLASRLEQLLPYPAVAAALGVTVAEQVTHSALDFFTFWTVLAIVVIALVRQYLALGANVALVDNLAAREREMEYQAHHDSLTGLANRIHFQGAVTHTLDEAADDSTPCAVLFIDIDDFKQVNDRYGHATGDSLLRLVAARLKANLRPEDTEARLGGDEFAVLVEKASEPRQVNAIAERILKALREPGAINGRTLPVRGTIGVAFAEPGVRKCEELLRRADIAMYIAKRGGKDRCAVYDEAAPEPEAPIPAAAVV